MTSPNQLSPTAVSPSTRTSLRPFLLITFGISWGGWLLLALTGRNAFQDLEMGTLLILGGFGPTIGAIWLTQRSGNLALIEAYWRRVFAWRCIGLRWYAPVLLLYPTTVLLAFLINGRLPDFSPLQTLLREPAYLVATLIFVFIFGPFAEELGWRGYALDWLQARYSAFVASIILGVIWWAWHLPLLLVPGSFLHSSGGDPVFLAGYLGTVIIYSVLFTWAYNNNQRSILSAILFHFSINLTSRLVAMSADIFVTVTFVLIVVMLLLLWRFGGRRLARV